MTMMRKALYMLGLNVITDRTHVNDGGIMCGSIKGFLVAAFIAFAISDATASRPSYSDSVTVPQVNSNMNGNQKVPQQNANVSAWPEGGDQLGFMRADGSWTAGNGGEGTGSADGVVYDKNGREVGVTGKGTLFVDNNGRLKYSQGGDDVIRNPAGEAIGKSWNTGKVEWNCKPGEECKSVLATSSNDGDLECDETNCEETAVINGTKTYSTLAEAILASRDKFANICDAESSYKVLRTKKMGTDGKPGYLVAFRGYAKDKEEAKGLAPVSTALPKDDFEDFEIVAFIHNHPIKDGLKIDWFSTGDAMTAKKFKKDIIVYGCTTDVFLWLHYDQGGIVTRLNGEVISEPEESKLELLPITNTEKEGELGEVARANNYNIEEYNYYKRRMDGGFFIYKAYENTPYNPQDWDNLGSCKVDVCNGVEGTEINMMAMLNIVDFNALVPDKIWTEPIIGALVEGVIEESGRAIPGKEVDWRKQGVDWWGAKWMGKRFHTHIPYDEHGESPYHLFGFFINSGICPYVYSAPISEFSLDDAFRLEGKVKKMIEDNTGIKLICEKNDIKPKNVKTECYKHTYRFDSVHCTVSFNSNIKISGMYVNDKKSLTGKVWKEKSQISIEMSFGVGLRDCMYWHEYQKKFDGEKYSVRDLLQGNVKAK